jgi:hypothetical protein
MPQIAPAGGSRGEAPPVATPGIKEVLVSEPTRTSLVG